MEGATVPKGGTQKGPRLYPPFLMISIYTIKAYGWYAIKAYGWCVYILLKLMDDIYIYICY